MKINFGTKRSIELLTPRREPYWSQIDGMPGKSIGVRKAETGNIFWLARQAGVNGKKYVQVSLNATNFTDAVKEAKAALFDPLDNGATFSNQTVLDAFKDYYVSVEASANNRSTENSLGALANVKLRDLQKTHIVAWVESDDLRLGHNGKPRSLGTIKRMISSVRAALNRALHRGTLQTGDWRLGFSTRYIDTNGLGAGKKDERRYLTPAERRAIIKHARFDCQGWLTLCASLPLRPGDWADRRVEHFDQVSGNIFVESKNHPRHMKLPPKMLALIKEQCRNKLPKALIFTRQNDGKSIWNAINWNERYKEAAVAAGISGNTVLYDFRHSVITELLEADLSPTQVAKIAGTSVLMIEKHYSKSLPDRQREALERIAV